MEGLDEFIGSYDPVQPTEVLVSENVEEADLLELPDMIKTLTLIKSEAKSVSDAVYDIIKYSQDIQEFGEGDTNTDNTITYAESLLKTKDIDKIKKLLEAITKTIYRRKDYAILENEKNDEYLKEANNQEQRIKGFKINLSETMIRGWNNINEGLEFTKSDININENRFPVYITAETKGKKLYLFKGINRKWMIIESDDDGSIDNAMKKAEQLVKQECYGFNDCEEVQPGDQPGIQLEGKVLVYKDTSGQVITSVKSKRARWAGDLEWDLRYNDGGVDKYETVNLVIEEIPINLKQKLSRGIKRLTNKFKKSGGNRYRKRSNRKKSNRKRSTKKIKRSSRRKSRKKTKRLSRRKRN